MMPGQTGLDFRIVKRGRSESTRPQPRVRGRWELLSDVFGGNQQPGGTYSAPPYLTQEEAVRLGFGQPADQQPNWKDQFSKPLPKDHPLNPLSKNKPFQLSYTPDRSNIFQPAPNELADLASAFGAQPVTGMGSGYLILPGGRKTTAFNAAQVLQSFGGDVQKALAALQSGAVGRVGPVTNTGVSGGLADMPFGALVSLNSPVSGGKVQKPPDSTLHKEVIPRLSGGDSALASAASAQARTPVNRKLDTNQQSQLTSLLQQLTPILLSMLRGKV